VAALTIDAARATRAEARRLRVDSLGLSVAVERNLRLATAEKERAKAATARAGSVVPVTSPWSRLEWLRADGELNRVLVLVD